MPRWIFKVLRPNEWRAAKATLTFKGAPIDEADGFIHFSYKHQLGETIARHFSDEPTLYVLAFDENLWSETVLKAEPSRGGDLFPHFYDFLNVGLAAKVWVIENQSDNKNKLSEIESWLSNV